MIRKDDIGDSNMTALSHIKKNSVATPAMFVVRALVLPISKLTAAFRANAQVAFANMMVAEWCAERDSFKSFVIGDSSKSAKGANKKTKQAGET